MQILLLQKRSLLSSIGKKRMFKRCNKQRKSVFTNWKKKQWVHGRTVKASNGAINKLCVE